MEFYKGTDGLWRIAGYILPPGALFMRVNATLQTVELMWSDRKTIFQKEKHVSTITDSSDAPYADIDAFLTAAADFFK